MIVFIIFCIQIFYVQYAFTQAVAAPAIINNGLVSGFEANIPGLAVQQISGQRYALAGPNNGFPGPGLGPLLGSLQGQGFSPMGPQAYGPMGPQAYNLASGQQIGPFGVPPGVAGNPLAGYGAGYIPAYGGSGSGEVAVSGELPVAGNTAITGQVPMSGKVQFAGSIPAGGAVIITGQCSCGCNGGNNAPYAANPVYYNNKPYIY